MFSYTICNMADDEIFYKQCDALKKHIPELKEEKQLQDVDSSLIGIYKLEDKELKILSDKNIDAVYIESEFDIEEYFQG